MAENQYRVPDISLVGPDHVRRYQETAGQVGYIWNGATILLLTSIGRKSGLPRTNALIFGQDGDDYLVVASIGGAPQHPLWYRNLLDRPEAEIQVRDRHIQVTATTTADDDKARLWQIMTKVWPNYDVYQSRTHRVIPVVVLTPANEACRDETH